MNHLEDPSDMNDGKPTLTRRQARAIEARVARLRHSTPATFSVPLGIGEALAGVGKLALVVGVLAMLWLLIVLAFLADMPTPPTP